MKIIHSELVAVTLASTAWSVLLLSIEMRTNQIKIDSRMEDALKAHHQLQDGGHGINEAHMALVDTACTSCMHSRRWSKGYACEKTEKSKIFHFADGNSTSANVSGKPIRAGAVGRDRDRDYPFIAEHTSYGGLRCGTVHAQEGHSFG